MKITIVQRSIPPDRSAAGRMAFDLASGLSKKGHEVTLLGCGKVPGQQRYSGTLTLEHVRGRSFSRTSITSRALALPATFVSLHAGLKRLPPADLLISLTDPPLLSLLVGRAARRYDATHIHWCQDLYPQTAAAAGVLNPRGVPYRALARLSRDGLRLANVIVAVGRCMSGKLEAFRPRTIPNWSSLPPGYQSPPPLQFNVMYSGNLGRAHDFTPFVEAARILKDDPVAFRVFGDGARVDEIRRAAASLPNLTLSTAVPDASLATHLTSASVHWISLREEFCGLVVPSKLYDCLASGRPVIFSGPRESEVARVLEESGAGIVVPPADSGALASALRDLCLSQEGWLRAARAAHEYARYHPIQKSLDQFDEVIRMAAR